MRILHYIQNYINIQIIKFSKDKTHTINTKIYRSRSSKFNLIFTFHTETLILNSNLHFLISKGNEKSHCSKISKTDHFYPFII